MTDDKHLRNKTISLAVTKEEYDFVYETGMLIDTSVSSWGRDLLITDALRVRNRLEYNPAA